MTDGSILRFDVRRGAYLDSIVLMQLQAALAAEPGIDDAGVVMATAANRALLAASGLLPEALDGPDEQPSDDDLLIVVRVHDAAAGDAALVRVDDLVARPRASDTGDDYRPKSLEGAFRLRPDARWVTISLPGRHAAPVARQAIEQGRNVFLYSDNVTKRDERTLKRAALDRGLLVMGPDCGTAIINGVGLGFANRVRRGPVGLIGASGTGLQAIASALDELGVGISHAVGTGGRDLNADIGASTTRQALALLGADPATRVMVLVSKPPSPEVTAQVVLPTAHGLGKPVVVCFLGLVPPMPTLGNLHFATGLDDAARQAASLARAGHVAPTVSDELPPRATDLRGLFVGGTLALEAQLALRLVAQPLTSNVPIADAVPLDDPTSSRGHTVLDMGADEFTVGRLHPMMDPDLRLRRLRQESADPAVGMILLDVVLGVGAEADPAASLAPVIAEVLAARTDLRVTVVVVGTGDDPQDRGRQVAALSRAGADVFARVDVALAAVCAWVLGGTRAELPTVESSALDTSAIVNVGLTSFHDSLCDQGVEALHVEWRPPAGGDARLATLLARMQG